MGEEVKKIGGFVNASGQKTPGRQSRSGVLRGERNETSYDNEITFLMPSLRPSSRSPYASIGKRPVISAFTALGQRSKKTPRSRIEFSNESRPALTVPKTPWFFSTRYRLRSAPCVRELL